MTRPISCPGTSFLWQVVAHSFREDLAFIATRRDAASSDTGVILALYVIEVEVAKGGLHRGKIEVWFFPDYQLDILLVAGEALTDDGYEEPVRDWLIRLLQQPRGFLDVLVQVLSLLRARYRKGLLRRAKVLIGDPCTLTRVFGEHPAHFRGSHGCF